VYYLLTTEVLLDLQITMANCMFQVKNVTFQTERWLQSSLHLWNNAVSLCRGGGAT